jgi:Uncharacterized protein conserved in bacteria
MNPEPLPIPLAIFVKTPGLSPIKTRLAAQRGAAQAEHFHQLAAACVAESALATAGLAPCWAVAETTALADPRWLGLPALAQGEGDLGARMRCVYERLLQDHGAALLIGADLPQVRPADFLAAIAVLRGASTPWVLGPASDGGFWLVGGREPIPAAAWRDTPWSQPNTAARFAAACGAQQPARLRVLRDVDEAADLDALASELTAATAARPAQAALRDWLRTTGASG